MAIRILHGDIHLIELQTRLPFKYGIATMTRAPQAFVRLFVEIDGRPATGISADLLPPKWFTKIPEKPLDEEIDEMLDVIDHAVASSAGMTGPTVFDVWRQVFESQQQWGRERGYPSLLWQFGVTFVERALIEAYCRAVKRRFGKVVRANEFGIRLDEFDARLAGHEPSEFLPEAPREFIIARHTVGMADPLEDSDIEPGGKLNDGLPQSLYQCINWYGLYHFKLKVSGKSEADIDRLTRIFALIRHRGPFAFTLDGNETFRSLANFRDYWESLMRAPQLDRFLTQLMFVEQPFHRDVALDPDVLGGLLAWSERPALIIDESDADLDSLPRALELGYHGTSHKNCKGVFKGIANACLLELLKCQSPNRRLVMSGEDLANIGPIALLQDLAVVATLGIESVERNGHHYFAGLSAFPKQVQEQVWDRHVDLYEPSDAGWPTLWMDGGSLCLDSVIRSPFGVGFELDVTQFTPRSQWKMNSTP